MRFALAMLALGATGVAHAQRWPRIESIEAAHAHRDADLARALGITVSQAQTVFAQMIYPPHAARARSVVSESQPTGIRNVFAILDFVPLADCRIDGYSAAECRERPRSGGIQSHLLLVQIDASGRVVRTEVDLAFGTPARFDGVLHPSTLRLFSPAPGAPSVAIVEGTTSLPAARDEYGDRQPPEYIHDLYVWDGRRGRQYRVSSHMGQANLGTIVIDSEAHRIVKRSLRCDAPCTCRIPRDIASEAAQLARMTGACAPSDEPLELPAGLHLVDDDLDARTPRFTHEEALAARVPALMHASGLTQAQAEQVVATHTTLQAPRFGRFVSHTAEGGTRELYGIVEMPHFESCVYHQRDRSTYDSVRACAYEQTTMGKVLYVRLAADGTVAETALAWIGIHGVADLHLAQDARGVYAAAEELVVADNPGGRQVLHTVVFQRRGQPAGRHYVTYAIETCACRGSDQNYAGELIVQPAEGNLETLTRRRVACTERCPCGPLPITAADAHALVERRVHAEDPACRPQEAAVVPE